VFPLYQAYNPEHYAASYIRNDYNRRYCQVQGLSKNAVEVLDKMKKAGFCESVIHRHKLCYDWLGVYLNEHQLDYSLEAGIEWLESYKYKWKAITYKQYRLPLYRLDHYVKTGSIERDTTVGRKFYAFHDDGNKLYGLPENYQAIAREYYDKASKLFVHNVARSYYSGVLDFLSFLCKNGCFNLSDLSLKLLSAYSDERESYSAEQRKQISGVKQLIAQLCESGNISSYFTSVSFSERETGLKILYVPKEQRGDAVKPSEFLESKRDEFLALLKQRGYGDECVGDYAATIIELVKFLEINHLKYSYATVALFMNRFTDDEAIKLRRQHLRQLDDFLKTGELKKVRNYAWVPTKMSYLPEWCQAIMSDYLKSREREGVVAGTVKNSMRACQRFFEFVVSKGINTPSEIDAELIKEFHNTDVHATSRSRNSYAGRVRRLLRYMADVNLVPQNLYLALSNESAQVRQIVSVLTPGMENAIYAFRQNARTPLELRDAAIVVIGLRLGLRASDVVKLRLSDLDLNNRKLSIIQAKTNRAVSLPIPIDVGNSIYRYIIDGRPQSGEAGYIFVSHNAPFRAVSYAVCGNALKRVLSSANIELPSGQGFHITRRTFATHLLTARTEINRIAESLGHTDTMSVDVYLAHDEASMRLCPLSFSVGGIV
jgi:site-specific recombinase XerD